MDVWSSAAVDIGTAEGVDLGNAASALFDLLEAQIPFADGEWPEDEVRIGITLTADQWRGGIRVVRAELRVTADEGESTACLVEFLARLTEQLPPSLS
jgi:hypothetical protein